jgi:hypothetical protein
MSIDFFFFCSQSLALKNSYYAIRCSINTWITDFAANWNMSRPEAAVSLGSLKDALLPDSITHFILQGTVGLVEPSSKYFFHGI